MMGVFDVLEYLIDIKEKKEKFNKKKYLRLLKESEICRESKLNIEKQRLKTLEILRG